MKEYEKACLIAFFDLNAIAHVCSYLRSFSFCLDLGRALINESEPSASFEFQALSSLATL